MKNLFSKHSKTKAVDEDCNILSEAKHYRLKEERINLRKNKS